MEWRQGEGYIQAESVPLELGSHFLVAQQFQRACREPPALTFRSTLWACEAWLCRMTWESHRS